MMFPAQTIAITNARPSALKSLISVSIPYACKTNDGINTRQTAKLSLTTNFHIVLLSIIKHVTCCSVGGKQCKC